VSSAALGSAAWLVPLLARKGTTDAAAAAAAPVVDWRAKYGFKQPAPGVKSKSVPPKAHTEEGRGKKGGKASGLVLVGDGRGGMGAERGLDEVLAVVESALLQGEGRLPEAAAVLDKALGGAGGAAGGDEAASGGAAVCWEWIVAEVRLHLGLATLMLAEAAGEGGGEQDPLLTSLGRQLLRVSLDHSEGSCAAEERAEGDGGGASGSDGSDGEGEEALPSERALNAMKVPQLKALLAERDLPTSGKKADLIARLLGAAPAAPAGSPPSHTAAARKKVGEGKGAQGSRESRQAGAGGGTPEVTGAGRERGLRLLMSSWQALHPAGPPLLIRRCGRALAQVKRVCVCVCVAGARWRSYPANSLANVGIRDCVGGERVGDIFTGRRCRGSGRQNRRRPPSSSRRLWR